MFQSSSRLFEGIPGPLCSPSMDQHLVQVCISKISKLIEPQPLSSVFLMSTHINEFSPIRNSILLTFIKHSQNPGSDF